jgi:hypothetical protein
MLDQVLEMAFQRVGPPSAQVLHLLSQVVPVKPNGSPFQQSARLL